jgi:23S rRNA pseudouridine2605 synthase
MRLNRYLARSGVASRRHSDDLIRAGSVSINGTPVCEPGRRVEVGSDRVECQGKPVELPVDLEYIALNKPLSYLVTRRDSRDRRTVYELVEGRHPGTIAVGRLDRDTTGLLLLTNDGELAYRLSHPRFKVEKYYRVLVRGHVNDETLDHLRRGVELEDGLTAPAKVDVAERGAGETRLEMIIREGRKRQIRRMCATVGHEVVELDRRALGSLQLGDLALGSWRHLDEGETVELRSLAGLLR